MGGIFRVLRVFLRYQVNFLGMHNFSMSEAALFTFKIIESINYMQKIAKVNIQCKIFAALLRFLFEDAT